MLTRRRWFALLGPGCVAATLLAQLGCLSCCHPVPAPAPEQVMVCRTVPQNARSRVYVFLVDGLDPVRFCNFAGVHDYLIQLGFTKTYHGELYHCIWFNSEIHQIHKQDPDARFVFVGHGLGGWLAGEMARYLKNDNIPISLLVTVDGTLLDTSADGRPANVERVINLRVPSWYSSTAVVPGAETIQLEGSSTFAAATDRQTLDLLTYELMQVATTVPPRSVEPPTPPEPEVAPTPRPVQRPLTRTHDEWDFLAPTAQLSPASPVRFPSPPATAAVPSTQVHTTLKPKEPAEIR